MKTFKLISLSVVEEEQEQLTRTEIPLIDGLIINREDEKSQWMIEAYVNFNDRVVFEAYNQNHRDIILETKITKKSNPPAHFMARIESITEMEESISVLMKGVLVNRKNQEIENMLTALINEGFQGKDLLDEFKRRTELANL